MSKFYEKMHFLRFTFFVLLVSVVTSASLAYGDAQSDRGSAPLATEAQEFDEGEDITTIPQRIDFRYQFRALSDDKDRNTFITRIEKPFRLRDKWKLGVRLDFPVIYSGETSRDNPDGEWRAGAGDVLIQGVLIREFDQNNAFGFGSQLIVPTATEDQMGKGKVQLSPTIAWKTSMNRVCKGSLFIPLLRYAFDIGGSDRRSHISELQVNPIFHFPLPDGWSVRLWSSPDFKYDFRLNEWFIPADVAASKKLTKRFGIAFQLAAPIYHGDDFKSYDWKAETRFGFYY
jgi:hypothetical protein